VRDRYVRQSVMMVMHVAPVPKVPKEEDGVNGAKAEAAAPVYKRPRTPKKELVVRWPGVACSIS
jgi:hypothetical protein